LLLSYKALLGRPSDRLPVTGQTVRWQCRLQTYGVKRAADGDWPGLLVYPPRGDGVLMAEIQDVMSGLGCPRSQKSGIRWGC
jgi:hypothetical protein